MDNLLSRRDDLFVARGKKGKSRALTAERATLIAAALLLRRDLGVPLRRAAVLANDLLASGDGRVRLGALGMLSYDTPRLAALVRGALAEAILDQQQPRRGRPPRKQRGAPPSGDAPHL